jgi:hypothetical protein
VTFFVPSLQRVLVHEGSQAAQLPAKLAWPPPTPPLAAQFAASMMQPAHLGANWHEEAERARALREEHERAIARSSEVARQRAER